MNTHLEQTLRRISDALQFHPDGSFTFAGTHSAPWNANVVPGHHATPLAPLPNPTVQALQNALYAGCYTREFNGTLDQTMPPFNGPDDAWISHLSSANSSKERWEEGWQIQQLLPSGEVYARKGAVQRAFWPGEFMRTGEYGSAPQQGTPVAVFLPREARNAQPGFYFVFGDTPASPDEELPAVRFYWNLKQEGAAPVTQHLSATLNRYQIPFRFKVVNSPALLSRTDSAVLYVGRRFYRIACEVAFETRGKVAFGISNEIPLFTLRLAPGLAFAEDPGGQDSFGTSRCRLLAEALYLAHTEGLVSTNDRLARISQHFAAAGTSLERPYLNSASIQTYEFPQ